MPTTPAEWLPVLAKRADAQAADIERLLSYANGDAPLPEMSQNAKEAWRRFQKKARGNFGALIVSALSNRMIPIGASVGGSTDSEDAQRLTRIMRDTRFIIEARDAISDAFQARRGYLVLGQDGNEPVITCEKPDHMIAVTDPLKPWRTTAAMKWWSEPDADDGPRDVCYVWADGERQRFVRPAPEYKVRSKLHDDKWVAEGDPATYDGPAPVYVFENRDGQAEYEPYTDIIDRINLGVLNRLVVVAMQAFRQRALISKTSAGSPQMGGLPKKDPDGNDIDYTKLFEAAPGALWDLTDFPIEIWESAVTDPQPLLMSVKDDLRDLSAVSETPLAALVPDGANQTAEGAEFQREAIIHKALDRIARFKAPLAAVLVHAMRIAGVDEPDTVEVIFASPAYVSLSEKMAAASQMSAILPPKTIMREVLGWSPEQIREAMRDRAQNVLEAGLAGEPADAAQQ